MAYLRRRPAPVQAKCFAMRHSKCHAVLQTPPPILLLPQTATVSPRPRRCRRCKLAAMHKARRHPTMPCKECSNRVAHEHELRSGGRRFNFSLQSVLATAEDSARALVEPCRMIASCCSPPSRATTSTAAVTTKRQTAPRPSRGSVGHGQHRGSRS